MENQIKVRFDGLTLMCGDSPEELYDTLDRLYDNLSDAGRDTFWGGDSYAFIDAEDDGYRYEIDLASVYIGLYWARANGALISHPVAYIPGPLDTFERFMEDKGEDDEDWLPRLVYHWAMNWKPEAANGAQS